MAVHHVTALTMLSEFIASDQVLPGDVLLLADGVYRQSVLVLKNDIRIVAGGKGVVFDGEGVLATGILLYNVTGVELLGLRIRNYLHAVSLLRGSGNRIIGNHLADIQDIGILVSGSSGNLIYDNVAEGVGRDAIRVLSGSTANFVLENEARGSGDGGIDCVFPEDANNAFIGNAVGDNDGFGFELSGDDCLAFANVAKAEGRIGFYLLIGDNIVLLHNESQGYRLGGVRTDSDNSYVASNQIQGNQGAGISVRANFNILAQNEIRCNQGDGLSIEENGDYNLILRNRLVGNVPSDIADGGTGNNFVQNVTGEPPCGCGQPGVQGDAGGSGDAPHHRMGKGGEEPWRYSMLRRRPI